MPQWLHRGLVAEGFEVVLLETRHVKAALSAMTISAIWGAAVKRVGGQASHTFSASSRGRFVSTKIFPQLCLKQLSRRGVRQTIDKDDIIRDVTP